MILKALNKLHQQLSWEFLISIFFVWGCLLFALLDDFSFDLSSPSKHFFSEATRHGVDIGNRVSFYYKVVGLSFLVFFSLYFPALWIKSVIQYSPYWKNALLLFSVLGCLNLFSQLIGIDTTSTRYLILYVIGGICIFSFLSKYEKFQFLNSSNFLFLALGCSFQFAFVIYITTNSDRFMNQNGVEIIVAISFIVLLIYYFLSKIEKEKSFLHEFTFFLIPLPYLVFFCSETIFFCKFKFNISLNLSILMPIILTVFGFLRFIILRKGKILDEQKLVKRLSLSVLITFLLCTYFTSFQTGVINEFEIANITNSQMRFWKFGEIPFLNFLSSHVLSEQWTGYLYHSIFGYFGNLDFLTYYPLHYILFTLFGFLILRKLFESQLLALILIVFMPLLFESMGWAFFGAFMPFLLSLRPETNTKWFVSYFALSIFLLFLKIDLGVSIFYASILWLPLLIFTKHITVKYIDILKALGIIAGSIFVLICFSLIFVSFKELKENFIQTFHYISANQGHGLHQLSNQEDHRYFLYYLGIPLISISIVIISTLILKKKLVDSSVKLFFQFSAFAALFALANFQRGLVRHSLLLGWDKVVFSTIILSLTCFIVGCVCYKRIITKIQRLTLFISILLCLFLAIKNGDLSQQTSLSENFLEANSYKKFDSKFKKITNSRTLVKNEKVNKKYKELKTFFNRFENKRETFIDFSNVPNLYFILQRKVPSYFNQSLQNMVGDELQISHIKRWKKEKPKFVLFSRIPSYTEAFADGVSYNLRYYLVSSFIYANYSPHRSIDGLSIWIRNQEKVSYTLPEMDSSFIASQSFEYGQMGSFFGDFLENHKPNMLKTEFVNNYVYVSDTTLYPITFTDSLKIKTVQVKSRYMILQLDKINDNQTYTIEILNNGIVISSYIGQFKKGKNKYGFVLSNTFGWFQPGLKTFRWKDRLKNQKIRMKLVLDKRL